MLTLTLERQSWAHGLPVGWKLLVLLAITIFVFPINSMGWLIALLALNLALYASLGRVGFSAGLTALRPLLWFVFIILGYHVAVGDTFSGAIVVCKMIGLVAVANFVTMTSRIADVMELVIWLLSPLRVFGVKPERIGLAFALVIRFTPTLSQRGSLLAQAWRARSRKRVGVRIIAPLAISALDDADHVAEALRARGGI